MKDLKILQFRFLRVCVENVVSRETICLTGTTFVLHVARAIFQLFTTQHATYEVMRKQEKSGAHFVF